jgi:hypothetical protein
MWPHDKAEPMAAPDQSVKRPKTLLPRRRRPHTAFCAVRALIADNPLRHTPEGKPADLRPFPPTSPPARAVLAHSTAERLFSMGAVRNRG